MAGRRWWLAALAVVAGLAMGVGLIASSLASVVAGEDWSTLLSTIPRDYRTGDASIGRADAAVAIDIYEDFQCGHCARLHGTVEPELLWRYVATGKARIRMHMVPVLGVESVSAAEAVLVASGMGRYWEYRDALFRAWQREGKTAYSAGSLVSIASQVGLDAATFRERLESGSARETLVAEARDFQARGFKGVPVTVIDGRAIEGAQPVSVYTTAIEESLR